MNIASKKEIVHLSPELTQKKLLNFALEQKIPLAIWKLPQQKRQNLILDFSETIQQNKLNLEDSKKGFVVSPFLNQNLENSYFIKADLHYHSEMQGVDLTQNINSDTEKAFYFKQNFQNFLKNSEVKNKIQLPEVHFQVSNIDNKHHYQTIVAKAVRKMQAQAFQKVVLSRPKEISLEEDFDLIDNFQKLCRKYNNAFIYIFFLPKVGLWMGATPETLIKTDEQDIFHTVALAGTQAYQENTAISEVLWKQKEIEEQAMVSRYIINSFKKIRLREFEEAGPKTVRAGNLLHLQTKFEVDMQACNFMQLGSVMLELLHPTSAVCGMPKEEALNFILAEEGYNREFYSGFLGPINIENQSHIFVNLRCMQFSKDKARLYAGAGITVDSDPIKEWQETEMKSKTLLNILENIRYS